MNLRSLKYSYEMANGNMLFVVDTDAKKELKKKLFSPPLQGMLDAYPSQTPDGRDIVIIPKTKKNDLAFQKLEIVPPESEKVETKPTSFTPKKEEPVIEEAPEPEPKKVVVEKKLSVGQSTDTTKSKSKS